MNKIAKMFNQKQNNLKQLVLPTYFKDNMFKNLDTSSRIDLKLKF